MTLELLFWAFDEANARVLGEQWITAEPKVESGHVVSVRHVPPRPTLTGLSDRYLVTVELTMRSDDADQAALWG